MTFGDTLQLTKEAIQCALDDLTSPRSSSHYQSKALQKLEYLLALACCASGVNNRSEDDKDSFFALQYTFECNVPSKLLSWITLATLRLEGITNKGLMEDGRGREAEELAAQLALSLSLIQGVALNHESSKIYLGRKCSLEILLDLLLASRHLSLPAETAETSSKSKTASTSPPLTSIVLDTLLCILVDSCAAIRAFEEANGTQAVVKILKRAGTPREVRMKCLEFLYFYLLDETPTSMEALETVQSPTAPATPIRTSKPYLSATPMRPLSRYGSSTFSFSSPTSSSQYTSTSSLSNSGSSTSSSSSSRSTSGSSAHSFSSTSSTASLSTTVSSISSLPEKEAGSALSPAKSFLKSPGYRITTPQQQQQQPCTPPTSPPLATVGTARFPQVRSMMMLKKEVDYTPQSPKKVAGLGARHPYGHSRNLSASTSFHSRSKSRLISTESLHEEIHQSLDISSPSKQDLDRTAAAATAGRHRQENWRTTEEKKELLGTMLGNVDALVEGVRKAGIWGLG
ncbi:CDC14-domain-containing protein [Phlegmacium glaucopus]|nr:CDC14-domain-containing protein [Phlegmacium glaucopus]